MNGGDEMVRGLGDVLRTAVDGAWRVAPEHDPGCLGDERYCVPHCPIPVQVEVPLSELAEALAAHVLGLVAAGKAEALRVCRQVEADMSEQAAEAWRSADARRDLSDGDALLAHADALTRWSERFRMAFDGDYYRADGLAGEAS